ncbi:hypothetical protein ZWY2020_008459 [Hordeum vulgare]|nr:hypothetical protein ZWY2020_008459 [Hordeum vulgare]
MSLSVAASSTNLQPPTQRMGSALNEKRYWKDWVSVDSPTIHNERSGAAGTLLLPSCSYASAGTETGWIYIGGSRILKLGVARGTGRAWLRWGGTAMARGHGWVEIVMAFEEEFSFEIPDNEAEKIDSIKSAVDFIASHPQANSMVDARSRRRPGRDLWEPRRSKEAAKAVEGQHRHHKVEDSKLKMYEGKVSLYEALGVLYEGHIAQGRHCLTSRKPPTITKSGSNFGPKEKMVASSSKRNTRDRCDDSMRTHSIIDINDIPAWDDVDGDAERENTVRDEEEFGSDADGDHPQISESSAKGRRPKKQKSATSVQRLEDSMMAVEIVTAFEEEFSFEIPDNEAEKIDSIKSAVDFIASHPQAKQHGWTRRSRRRPGMDWWEGLMRSSCNKAVEGQWHRHHKVVLLTLQGYEAR